MSDEAISPDELRALIREMKDLTTLSRALIRQKKEERFSRPERRNNEPKKMWGMMMTAAQRERLKQAAAAEGMTVASLVRRLIDDHLLRRHT